MNWITIFELIAEGGSLTLSGSKNEHGIWSFKFSTDERTMMDEGDKPEDFMFNTQPVQGWNNVLNLLYEKYGNWYKFYPSKIHPDFAQSLCNQAIPHKPHNIEKWEEYLSLEKSSLYSYDATVEKITNAIKESPEFIYKSPCVNWVGNITDCDKAPSTEVIASVLLQIDMKNIGITEITRNSSYLAHPKQAVLSDKKVTRKEDREAIRLFNNGVEGKCLSFGRIIEYQVPIKNIQTDKAGKIDLVAFAPDESLYLIELKVNPNKETLLRAVLEIEIYSQQLNIPKLEDDFTKKGYPVSEVKKALLLYPGCNAHDEYLKMLDGKRPAIQKLIDSLGITIFDNVAEVTCNL